MNRSDQRPTSASTTIVQRRLKRKKRCHGNGKLRRFRKKCRQRGLTQEQIQAFIDNYIPDETRNIQRTTTTTNVTNRTTRNEKRKSKKPKHSNTMIRWQLLRQGLPKKRKKIITKRKPIVQKQNIKVKINMLSIRSNYHSPMYLKTSRTLVFQILTTQLKRNLRSKVKQTFIYERLHLFDRYCRIELHTHLWQSFLNLGSEHQIWPNRIYKLAKSGEHPHCLRYVQRRLNQLKQQSQLCWQELTNQAKTCPIRLLPVDNLDQHLKAFVQVQQNYFATKLNSQLTRYQDVIQEKQLYQTLSMHPLTTDQKALMEQLLRQQDLQFEWLEEFSKLETRIAMEFLPREYDYVDKFLTLSHLFVPTAKDDLYLSHQQQIFKSIQETKRLWLNRWTYLYEQQLQTCDEQYHHLFEELQYKFMRTMPLNVTTIYNSLLTYMNHRQHRITMEMYQEKLPVYRKRMLRLSQYVQETSSTTQQNQKEKKKQKKRRKKNQQHVNVSPQVIIDLKYHPFTAREIAYLSKGPTYIRYNQTVFYSKKARQKHVDREHRTIMKRMTDFMGKLRDPPKLSSNASIFKLYSERLRTYLMQHYMTTTLPLMNQLRARRELKMVQSIRSKLRRYHLVLRETDKSGVLHIGHAKDYERKAIQYRQKTNAYRELDSNPYISIITTVTRLLHQLKTTNRISEKLRMKLTPQRLKTQLAYLYFLPKAHKEGTPLRPIVNTIHAATTLISKYLDQRIRPLFNRFVHKTTIIDGTSLLHQLQTYIQTGRFTASTLFITFDITNLYTMLPQEESLKILAEFLREFHCEQIDGLSIETIVELARIVLQGNVFVYNRKFYQQTVGGAMGSAFTLTLANIFMWKWEKETILSKLPPGELYGRYIDDVFFTWNGSVDEVKQILEQANKYHPNIKLDYQISQSLPFLDILLTNQHGQLVSSVYHKPAAEPTVVSFVSDHPRHVFRNVIQTSLARAIRYSSTFELFNQERRAIRLMLLYSGYPSKYINDQFQRYFNDLLSSSSSSISSILPFLQNENQFLLVRDKLHRQPTVQQTQFNRSISSVNIDSEQAKVTFTDSKEKKFETNLFVHCTYETRLSGLAREIHQIHDSFFKNTDYGQIRLIVGHRNHLNIVRELGRKRPSSSLIKDPDRKKFKPNEPATTISN